MPMEHGKGATMDAIDLQHHKAITKACQWQVWQLKKKNTSLWASVQDWNQELYARCLSTKPRYDAARASMFTYYSRVAANAATDIGRQITREANLLVYQEDIDLRSSEPPANDSNWSDGGSDREDDSDRVSDWDLSASLEHFATEEFKADLQDVVSTMPNEMQALYNELSECKKVSDVEKASPLSTATFYRRKKSLKERLQKEGIWTPKEKIENMSPYLLIG